MPTSAVEILSLKTALDKGEPGVREYFTGPDASPYKKEEQINRMGEALQVMRNNPAMLKLEEKNKVLGALDQLAEKYENGKEKAELQKQLAEAREEVKKQTAAALAAIKEQPKDTFLPRTADPREWTTKQIATVATLTIGAVALYRLFFKGKSKESSGDHGLLHKLAWIPFLGIGAIMLYGGHKMLMELKGYRDFMKNHLGVGEDKYGLTSESHSNAEKAYRQSFGRDDTKIREIFGLKPGEKNAKFDLFMKDMSEKYREYDPKNGIMYMRGDGAMRVYEDQLEAAFGQMREWISRHKIEVVAVALGLNQLGVLEIKRILSLTISAADKSRQLVTAIGTRALRHPFFSLFVVGAGILAEKGIVAASKRIQLAEDFGQLGKAFAEGKPVVTGELADSVRNTLGGLKNSAINLAAIGKDFEGWMERSIASLSDNLSNNVGEGVSEKPEEVAIDNNLGALDAFRTKLKHRAEGASVEQAKEGTKIKCEKALEKLAAFEELLVRERLEQTTESDAPQKAFEELKTALQELGITLVTKNGIVRYKEEGKEEIDLCVDPSLKKKQDILKASKEMRRGDESDLTAMWHRALADARVKLGKGMDKMDWIPAGKTFAMIVGTQVYIYDPENAGEFFFVAPYDVVKDLFINRSELPTDLAKGAVGAGFVSINMAALRQAKRFVIGGSDVATVRRLSWRTLGMLNPVTAPLHLVRDAARTVIEYESFTKWRAAGKDWRDAWLYNTVLGKKGIKAEWIAVVMDPKSTDEALIEVAKKLQTGVVKDRELFRESLKREILRKLEGTQTFRARNLGWETFNRGQCEDLFRSIQDWSQTKSRAQRISEGIEKGLHKISYKGLWQGATGMFLVEKLDGGKLAPEASPVRSAAEAKINELDPKNPALRKELQATEKLTGGAATDILDHSAFQKFLSGRTASAEELKLFLKQENKIADPKTLDALMNSEEGKKLLNGALRSASPEAEVSRVFRMGRAARNLRVGLTTAVGIGGDVFAAYLAYADYKEHNLKIAETDNQELKDLYSHAQLVDIAQGANGLIINGLFVGMALVNGTSVLTAIAAAGPAAILAAIAIGGGAYVAGKYEKVAETWLRNDKDLQKLSEAELLKQLIELRPGADNYWQRAAHSTNAELLYHEFTDSADSFRKWQEEGFNQIEGSNGGTRGKLLRAYFVKTAVNRNLVPAYPGEKEEVTKRRFDDFVADCLRYVYFSGGDSVINGQVLDQAQAHANVMMESRRLKEDPYADTNGIPKILHLQAGDGKGGMKDIDVNLATYADTAFQKKDGANPRMVANEALRFEGAKSAVEVLEMKKAVEVGKVPEWKNEQDLQMKLLMTCENHLQRIEARITAAVTGNAMGWFTEARQNKLRFMVAQNVLNIVHDEAKTLLAKKDVKPEDWNAAVQRLQASMQMSLDDTKYWSGDPKAIDKALPQSNDPTHPDSNKRFNELDNLSSLPQVLNVGWLSKNLILPEHREKKELEGAQYLLQGESIPGMKNFWKRQVNGQVAGSDKPAEEVTEYELSYSNRKDNVRFAFIDGEWRQRTGTSDAFYELKDVPAEANNDSDMSAVLRKLEEVNGMK